MNQTTTSWNVLIISTGYGNELLRSLAVDHVRSLGFTSHVYDQPGYPIDPLLHTHVNSVNAINSHDIILAFADETEGSEFQLEELSVELVDWLREKNILSATFSPNRNLTVFQMEVMTARALRKPTIVFVPKSVQARVDETITLLRSGNIRFSPRPGFVEKDPDQLIKQSDWQGLDANYEIPTGRLSSFRQILFLETLRNESPNFISYYDETNLNLLKDEISNRISSVVELLIREHIAYVNNLIETKRNPIGTNSLQDLINEGQIVSSPFKTLSGISKDDLFTLRGEGGGEIATSVLDGKSILLIGAPGLGKTTTTLLAFRDIVNKVKSGVEGYAPLYASWRDFSSIEEPSLYENEKKFFERFIKYLLGLPRNKSAWPSNLPLLVKKWILVIDGLDESSINRSSLLRIIEIASKESTLLVSCRLYDYERYLQQAKHYFHKVIELLPWKSDQIYLFTDSLRVSGKERAAVYIEGIIENEFWPEFISIPLWLSMLAYLSEKAQPKILSNKGYSFSDYELLRISSDAIAEDEVNRFEISTSDSSILKILWSKAAWLIHIARRENRSLKLDEIETILGVKNGDKLARAVMSSLDIFGVNVRGFFHEVFQEYWLAEYLVDRLVDDDTSHLEIARLFSFQRSVVTNRLIRSRIKAIENINKVGSRLREAFWAAEDLGEKSEFAKNQIVYLIGRVNDEQKTINFLRHIWGTNSETQFVKYSAAFAAILLGDPSIEKEYYNLISSSDEDDRINRGYHLYYYGDMDMSETMMPPLDDNSTPAFNTLRQLLRRQLRKEERHINIRRVELFTIRRFIETDRYFPEDVIDPNKIIMEAVQDFGTNKDQQFIEGVKKEAELIRVLLST